MKKTLFCLIAAVLMLIAFVSAQLSEPDAQGNVVCSGQYDLTTKYNVEKLNAIMRSLSDPAMISEEDITLAACTDTGSVRLGYRIADGGFVEFAKVYGTVTANPATGKIEIADGAVMPLEAPEGGSPVPVANIWGKTITLQFVKDAQQKVKPMFKVSKDGAVSMKEGNIFFGCLKKDAEGRAVNCELSGQLYKENDAEGYLTITGSGFISEKEAGGIDIMSQYGSNVNNLEELGEATADMNGFEEMESPRDFVAIPLTNLKEIQVIIEDYRANREPYIDLEAKAQADTSAFDAVQVKSASKIRIPSFIENYRPDAGYGSGVGIIPIGFRDNTKVTVSERWLNGGVPFTASTAYAGERDDKIDAGVSIFESSNKLAEVVGGGVSIFPETAEDAYNSFTAEEGIARDSILLKPSSKEKRIYATGFNNIDVRLLPGYETVTIIQNIDAGSEAGYVKVTNPRNNVWILYENGELTWTPGISIEQLGFNFNVNLNPTLGDAEMLSCTSDGVCWLGSTMVIGATPERIEELKEESPARREAGAAQKGTDVQCEEDEDCGREGYICYKRPGTADRYGTCLYGTPALRRGRETQGRKAASLPQFAECEVNSECKENEKCIGGECVVQCSNDAGCAPELTCRGGVCRIGCNTDVDCFEGKRCRNGACERISLPPFSEEAKTAEEAQAQCAKCGEGAFNLCEREECESLGTCYFREKTIGGSCTAVIATTPRQLTGEEFEEIIGEGQKGVGNEGAFSSAWGWVKGLFSAKTAEELPPFAECEIDSECGRSEKCIEGECLVQCRADTGCAPDFVCRGGVCRIGCNTDADCFQDQRCIEKLCARQRQTLPSFSEEP